jgi:glycosyltransferase involved in cell wall biosynthesis
MIKFSVLMSIYKNEKPHFFHRAMQSIWDDQILKPSQIVLVIDGKVPYELISAIDFWEKKLCGILSILPLNTNVGLGQALSKGLESCDYDIIARMDTDDISLPERFLKQVPLFDSLGVDLVGSHVSEFYGDEDNIVSYRRVPLEHQSIVSFAKKRSPVNHPTVIFRKSSVIESGGYMHMLWMEDYYLWIRMLMSGKKFYNVDEVLVKMRGGSDLLVRRSGREYFLCELTFLRASRTLGFINSVQFVKLFFLRACPRLFPRILFSLVYKLFLRK